MLTAEDKALRTKIQFGVEVKSRGGIYVGQNKASLRSVLNGNILRETYVMFYSEEAMADKELVWDPNTTLILELLGNARGNSLVVVV